MYTYIYMNISCFFKKTLIYFLFKIHLKKKEN